VVVGTTVASAEGSVIWWRAAAALIVSVAIQVGTNYANDYSDGIRGTDDARVGPVRLVASGLAEPGRVKLAAFATFGVAGGFGLALAAAAGWWLVAVGAACFLAGWLYTGGPRPYGYVGLGELFVFVFFGLVATTGTTYVQLGRITELSLASAVPVGLLATALLIVNNLRDIPTDSASGKKTLAVRLGAGRTRRTYAGAVCIALACGAALAMSRPWALLVLFVVPLAVAPVRRVLHGESGPGLISVLADTGRLQLLAGMLLAAGIAA
jgi:1,4-dihydroxy-2-naphthoate octaprenyltransferase